MNQRPRVEAPSADEIEGRFRQPLVLTTRPVILGGISLLSVVFRFKWTAEGLERLGDCKPPLIFAANHCSHADTAAIMGTLPRPIRRRACVAAALDVFGPARYVPRKTFKWLKRECLQIIVAGGFHAFAFDRHGSSLRSLRTATELVERGWSLVLYPEGTRSRTGEMAPFKPGVGLLAKTTGRPVIPVHVKGGRDILACGGFLPRPAHVMVRYGEPMIFSKGDSAAAFTERLRLRVRALAPVDADALVGSEVTIDG
jgi:long-chain acyl-CoA synthetase